MDDDEGEKNFIQIGTGVTGPSAAGRLPRFRADPFLDDGCEVGSNGLDVCLEEAGFDLSEDIANRFCFIRQLNGEAIFELSDELRNGFDLQNV